MALSGDRLQYSLRVGSLSADDLVVTGFRGVESVSTLFSFHIEAADSDQTRFLALADLLGQEATFTFTPPHGVERFVHGIISAVDSLGRREGRPRYELELSPLAWRLGVGRRTRIFQARATDEIVTAVLESGKVPLRAELAETYKPRELCLQYGESDLAFVWRLLESDGIHAYFDHDEAASTLALSDRIDDAPDSGALLPFYPPTSGVTTEEHAISVAQTAQLRPGAVALRDFNPLTPTVDLEAALPGSGPGADIEVYDYPGEHDTPDAGSRRARLQRDTLAGDAHLCNVASDCARLMPGFAFEITGHPAANFNGKFVALSVLHTGSDAEYQNSVLALPHGAPWRPARITRRPFVPGVQTAIVIGPSGEEIDTDKHGRVKVRFHWERASDKGDAGTCWLRTSQSWAGPGMGTLFVPRVGHEVLVRFLEGNPDRPLVVGSLYNGVNTPPAQLPANKTQSILRSNSSPGGGGFNELRYEDAAGQEDIYLQAQKNESIVVENDKAQVVRADESLLVQKDRTRTVDLNQTLAVTGNDVTVVQKNQSLTVAQNRTTETAGDHEESIDGSQTMGIKGAHLLTIAEGSDETVGGAKSIMVGGVMTITSGASLSYEVGAALKRKVLGGHKSFVGAGSAVVVEGNLTSETKGKVVLDIDESFKIATEKDHSVEIKGQDAQHTENLLDLAAGEIQVKATDKLTFSVDGKLRLEMAKSGALKMNAATFTIDGPLKTKASKIDKTSAGSAPSQSVTPPKPEELQAAKGRASALASVTMKGKGGRPIAGLKFEATMPDGSVKRGHLDGAGAASVPAPDSGDVKFTFPDLDKGEWES